jgi:hypothetical protein
VFTGPSALGALISGLSGFRLFREEGAFVDHPLMIAMNGDVVAFLRLTFAMVLASAWAEIGLLDGVRGFEKGNRRATCSKWRGPDRKFGKALREVARPAGLEPAPDPPPS